MTFTMLPLELVFLTSSFLLVAGLRNPKLWLIAVTSIPGETW